MKSSHSVVFYLMHLKLYILLYTSSFLSSWTNCTMHTHIYGLQYQIHSQDRLQQYNKRRVYLSKWKRVGRWGLYIYHADGELLHLQFLLLFQPFFLFYSLDYLRMESGSCAMTNLSLSSLPRPILLPRYVRMFFFIYLVFFTIKRREWSGTDYIDCNILLLRRLSI